jgi:hypothetical protein
MNRGQLLRAAKKGLLHAKCTMKLTDDYAFDNAVNFGKMSEFLPVALDVPHASRKYDNTEVYLDTDDFKCKSGYCGYPNELGEISLGIHSNLSYKVKIITSA